MPKSPNPDLLLKQIEHNLNEAYEYINEAQGLLNELYLYDKYDHRGTGTLSRLQKNAKKIGKVKGIIYDVYTETKDDGDTIFANIAESLYEDIKPMKRNRNRHKLYERLPPTVFINDDGSEIITYHDEVPIGLISDSANFGPKPHQILPLPTEKKAWIVAKAAAKKYGGKPIVEERLVPEWQIKKSKRASFDSPETGMLKVFVAAITNIKFDHMPYSSRKTIWRINQEFEA